MFADVLLPPSGFADWYMVGTPASWIIPLALSASLIAIFLLVARRARRRWKLLTLGFCVLAFVGTDLVVYAVGYANPGWRELPNLDIRVCIENLDEYPQWDFYLEYGMGRGNPAASPYLTKVGPADSTHLEGHGRGLTEVNLIAVPRGKPIAPPKPNWEKQGPLPEGSLPRTKLPGLRDARESHEFVYRLRIEGNRVYAEWTGPRVSANDDMSVLVMSAVATVFALLACLLVWQGGVSAAGAHPAFEQTSGGSEK